jgi:hypothetical protein
MLKWLCANFNFNVRYVSDARMLGFIEFGPEIAGQDQKGKLLLTSDDQVKLFFLELGLIWQI